MIEKDGKRGRTKENTGTNRKAEGIERNRTGMTKAKHKDGKRLKI
jgi:hypothetical protein